MNVYDAMAPGFNRRRVLPDGVAESLRDAVLARLPSGRPRLLDLGCGSGRIAGPFLTSGNDYTGVDLSLGMLTQFLVSWPDARLVRADGACLPFADAAFDAALLVQVLSGVPNWRPVLDETIRVLDRRGLLAVGRVVAPDDGIDATLKSRLAAILADQDIHPYRDKPRDAALAWLEQRFPDTETQPVASWTARKKPREFVERHGTGARFSKLPDQVRRDAMDRLSVWAAARFGGLDTAVAETHHFELTLFRT